MTRLRAVAVGGMAATILLGAFGSKGQGMSDAARNRLTALVGQVRQRAAAHDAAGAETALAKLRQNVTTFEHRGSISATDAAAIMHAADAVESKLTLITTTTTTTTEPPPPQDNGDHGKKRGHRKNEDNGDNNG